MGHAEPLQSGQGKHRRLDDTGLALGKPGVDIAAQVDDLQIGPAMQQLRAPAQRRGADDGAAFQVGDAPHVAGDQHVACILARQEGRDGELRWLRRRHVLHAVDGGIDPAGEQRLLDLLDEQSLAARFRQGPVLDGIARGLDDDDLDGIGCRERGYDGGQRVAHQAGLRKRELAAARAQSQEGRRHGRCSSVGGRPTLEDRPCG